jgi:hypothetical protein
MGGGEDLWEGLEGAGLGWRCRRGGCAAPTALRTGRKRAPHRQIQNGWAQDAAPLQGKGARRSEACGAPPALQNLFRIWFPRPHGLG